MARRSVMRLAQKPSRRLLRGVLGAALVALVVLLVFGARYFSDDLNCEAEIGDSNYGEAEWSWLPAGTTCRWTSGRNGFDDVEEPGWMPTVIVGGMFLSGAGLVLSSRSRRLDST